MIDEANLHLDPSDLAISALGAAVACLDEGDLAQARELVELVRINLSVMAAQGQAKH